MTETPAAETMMTRRDWLWNHRWVVGVWLLWIAILLVIAYAAAVFFYHGTPNPWNDPILPAHIPLWARWDSGWYATIIVNGYHFVAGKQSNVVFFPLFPYVVKGVANLIHANYFIVGSVLNAVFALISSFLVVGLAESIGLRTREQKERTLLALLLFPMAFFLLAFYTESLFLMLTLATLMLARTKHWWWAGIFGLLTALTRFPGMFIVVPLVIEWWQHHRDVRKPSWHSAIPLFLPLFGIAGFALYLQQRFGDPFLFFHGQDAWARGFQWPWLMLWNEYVKPLISAQANRFTQTYFRQVLELGTFVFVGWQLLRALLQKMTKHTPASDSSAVLPFLPWSLLVWGGIAFVIPILSGTLMSFPRYALVVFPAFLVIGGWKSRVSWIGYLMLASTLLAICAVLYMKWEWIA